MHKRVARIDAVAQFARPAGATRDPDPVPVSIVVPVLNEAEIIGPFLRHLRERAPDAELIVVDGGSTDGTEKIAGPLCDHLIKSRPGRGPQMNEGASASQGEVLWFLHADSEVALGSLEEIRGALADRKTVGGYFRIRLPKTHLIYRFTDTFAHYAGILLRIRCGDHGFFCRRKAFFQSGGFPNVTLMEDAEFFRLLHRFGRVRLVDRRLKTSARRYEQLGRVRVTFAYGLIATLFALGISPTKLASIYRRTCCAGPVR
jgi:rSAM/selenodomain-associated transferase 2